MGTATIAMSTKTEASTHLGDRFEVRAVCSVAVEANSAGGGVGSEVREAVGGEIRICLRSEKAVTTFGNRFDVAGILGVVPERLPQFANRNPETAVEVDEGVVPPDAVAQIVAGDDLPCIFQERDQEPEWLLLQLYPVPVFQELAGGGIHLEGAEPKERTERRLHIAPNARAFGPSVVHRGGSLRPISSYLIRDDLVVHRGIYDKFL